MSEAREVRFIRVPGAGLIEQKMSDLENSIKRLGTITNEWKDIKQKQRELRESIGKKLMILQDIAEKTMESIPVVRETGAKQSAAPKRIIEKVVEKEPLPKLPAPPAIKKRSEKLSQLRRELEGLHSQLK